jgi:hypothetical protein
VTASGFMKLVRSLLSPAGIKLKVSLGAAVVVFLCLQPRHPIVVTSSSVLNSVVFFALGIGLPWLAAIGIFSLRRRWSYWVAGFFSLLLLPYSLLWFVAIGFGASFSFDPLSQMEWQGSRIRAYQINGGATTDYGVDVRQERSLLPGILLVRRVDFLYPCASVDLGPRVDGINVSGVGLHCPGLGTDARMYRLKRFVYF